MSNIESDEREDIWYDPHKDRPTQRTLAGDSVAQKTQAKSYTDNNSGRGERRRKKKTLPRNSQIRTWRPYERADWWFGEAWRQFARSSRGAVRTVKVNSSDPVVARSGGVKTTAAMASKATEATALIWNLIS